MLHKTVAINIVALTPSLLGEHTPRLNAFCGRGKLASVVETLPALTCSAQATYLTGEPPAGHGIVANGWYFRGECEVKFWRQSNRLVEAPKIWEIARSQDADFRCANLFWWYNMYSTVDVAITPRPIYAADGTKIPDIYTTPSELRRDLQDELGRFPLFEFWGPAASINSSRWIAQAARRVEERYDPTLTLIYLPHLDYGLQKFGPSSPRMADELESIDHVAGSLIDFYERRGARVLLVSEYGIGEVSRPVHLNRRLRRAGLLSVREERGGEVLDPGASAAFAVADHQIAHVYVNDPAQKSRVRAILETTPGVERVLDDAGKKQECLEHPRSGDFIALSEADAWFTYYYWLDDRRAPDFARTVEIHRKPGYDPAELFIDPELRFPRLAIAKKLLKKKLGFRSVLDVIPLRAELVKGSHGRRSQTRALQPIAISNQPALMPDAPIKAPEVFELIGRHLGLEMPVRDDRDAANARGVGASV
jgi:predicted AlkP superfamily pyrophosphatase or phosphodiesterase